MGLLHQEHLGRSKSALQNKPPSALRRRRPPASSLGLNDRLRKIASASLLASGSPALANRSGAHSATRSKDMAGGKSSRAPPRWGGGRDARGGAGGGRRRGEGRA